MLIRSGIEILSSLPKLYWKDDARPGTEWIKFTKKKDPPLLTTTTKKDNNNKLWISLEEELSPGLGEGFAQEQQVLPIPPNVQLPPGLLPLKPIEPVTK